MKVIVLVLKLSETGKEYKEENYTLEKLGQGDINKVVKYLEKLSNRHQEETSN